MTNCIKCSTSIAEGVKFCPSCGEAVVIANAASPETENAHSQDILGEKLREFNETQDDTGDFDPADVEKNKIMAVLAYILFFIPLIAAKDSPFARYHTNQGLVLFIAAIILSVLAVVPIIGWIIAPLLALVITVFAVIGIINALGGKAKELPVIGRFRILK